jgi:uncharacterized protein YqgV (UPF0045/DUF77 family)
MLLELSVIPLARGRSISANIADLVKIIESSHLDYRLTAIRMWTDRDVEKLRKHKQKN